MMKQLLKWERLRSYHCLRELANMYIRLGACLSGVWTMDDCYGNVTLEDIVMRVM
jgi:hypothetical protein